MASASFKTPCPSCEAGVLVKDESLIGKKIDCPKCKYRFVVEAPNGTDRAAGAKKPAAVGVKAKAEAKGAPPVKTAAKTKPSAKAPAEQEDEDEKEAKGKKKKKGGSNKMILGLALAGLGVIVLVVGGFLLFVNKGTSPKTTPGGGGSRPGQGQSVSGNQESPNEQPGRKKKPEQKTNIEKAAAPMALAAAGPELTNLLPSQAQHVLHVFVKDALDPNSLFGEAALQPAALGDESFKQRLGFSVKAVDDLIRAENYTNSWAFTVVHLKEAVDEQALTQALGLAPAAGSPINGQPFFKVTKNNPLMKQLARVSLGTMPPPLPVKGEDRPLFVRIHGAQTLVFGDASPMQEFLGRGAAAVPAETYTTLKPALKTILDKLEKLPDPRDRVLFSAVTELEAARMDALPGRVQSRFRPIWDVAHALTDNPQRLRLLGAVLIRKGKSDPAIYRYQNEVECADDAVARTVAKDLREKVAPEVARFVEMLLGLKVDMASDEFVAQPGNPMIPGLRPPGPGSSVPGLIQPGPGGTRPPPGSGPPPATPLPPGQVAKEPVKIDPDKSQIIVASTDKAALFTLNLALNEKALPRLAGLADLLMVGLRGQLEVASGASHLSDLARAEKLLGEQGIPDHGVPPGHYPRGVFARKEAAPRSARDPGQRISWMAGLLPHLGQEALYARIKFDASWKDPANWMPASTLVPEFLDPSYPDQARFAPYPGIPFRLGGTHFVGIAGVGQDAPDYLADDPAVVAKLGVFGYDRMTSLDDIKKNRGLSHTGVMVQVPYDGPAGITPWMAGGGSTLRGVPETNSVKPFISTTQNGKRGAFLLMADASVRFVAEDVKDEVFKALCTINGPADAASLDRDAPVLRNAAADGKAAGR